MFSKCVTIFNTNIAAPRAEVVAKFVEGGCPPKSATVYYSKIKHPNGMQKKVSMTRTPSPKTSTTLSTDQSSKEATDADDPQDSVG